MPLNEYLDIDLKEGSTEYDDLMLQVANESDEKEVTLSDQGSHLPAYITPQMCSWYIKHIDGHRGSALQHLKSAFESMKAKKGVSGFLLEAELGEIKAKEHRDIKVEFDKFKADRGIKQKFDNLEDKTTQYQEMRNELDRDAKVWSPIKYWLGIVSVVIVEGLLNFESFTKIPEVTPFFATGMTLATAIFIGYAAHRHGIFIRQFGEEMGAHQGRKNKSTVLVRELMALLLLLVAMGIVAWGRYNLIQPIILDCQIDPESCDVSPWMQLVGAMLGNIGVYLFGMLWSYWNHDPVPGFMELRMEKEKVESEYNTLYKKQITDLVRGHQSTAEKEQDKKRSADRTFQPLPEYRQNQARFQEFLKKDSEVVALLDGYRNELIKAIRAHGDQTSFVVTDGFLSVDELAMGTSVETRRLTPQEYHGVQLRLKHITA